MRMAILKKILGCQTPLRGHEALELTEFLICTDRLFELAGVFFMYSAFQNIDRIFFFFFEFNYSYSVSLWRPICGLLLFYNSMSSIVHWAPLPRQRRSKVPFLIRSKFADLN